MIEDAAESFASKYKGRMSGTVGLMGTYSMHATKTITTGEGGMVVTASDELKNKMLLYRSHGMSRLRYWHDVAGHNFRLTNMQAALGCAQLEKLDLIIAERRRMLATYSRYLGKISGVEMQHFPAEVDPVAWVVAVKLDPRAFPQGRDQVIRDLETAHIETRPGFYTPTKMSHLYSAAPLPISDDVSEWVIALPSFPSLTDEQIELICSQLERLRR